MIELLTLFIGIFLAQVSPGPNLMAVAAASLGSGRAAGIATSLGIATGVVLWCAMFTLGVGAFIAAFPETLTILKILGGSYLLYIGIKSLKNALISKKSSTNYEKVKTSSRAAYQRGLLVVMTNPKAALMWVAISTFLASSDLGSLGFVIIGIGASTSAALIYGTYAFLFSTGTAMRGYQRFFRIIDSSFGAVFGLFGGKLLADGIKEW